MKIDVRPVEVKDIGPWRDMYRQEMNCQIVHDSMHARPGWTEPYRIELEGAAAGYGSILISGPWTGTRTAFEYYLAPKYRSRAFDCFEAFLQESQATALEAQTNDVVLTVMLHLWARNIVSEKILFEDTITMAHQLDGAVLKHRGEPPHHDWIIKQRGEPHHDWIIEIGGEVIANGGILYHYNRPYGDIYMEVDERYRQRGVGRYLVQELKRICYEGGSVPCARCNPDNVASQRTLQAAGFVPCAHILRGTL